MKHVALTAMLAVLAVPAYAQTQPEPSPQQPPAQQAPAPQEPSAQAPAAPADQPPKTITVEPKVMTEPEAAKPKTAAAGERFLEAQEQGQLLASRLIGRQAYNAAGQAVGDINDLLITPEGNLEAVVIGIGGFLGLGEKRVAVSFDQIKDNGGLSGERVVIGLTEDELRAAPDFKRLDRGEEVAQSGGQSGTGTASGSGEQSRTQ